ncbi:MAG: hypothetical protein GXO86_07625 [Chlorobi bacterium]|nr:hypothetical protein [Chlorobiota bacterium]
MNYNILRKPLFTFTAGIFFGISLISFYAFMNKSAVPQTGQIVKVDITSAAKLTKNYKAAAKPMDEVLNGFTVNTYQLEAMNRLLKENPAAAGFRIYLGLTPEGAKKSIVVGIDSNGTDATSGTKYKTSVRNSGPCPTVCDSSSPF